MYIYNKFTLLFKQINIHILYFMLNNNKNLLIFLFLTHPKAAPNVLFFLLKAILTIPSHSCRLNYFKFYYTFFKIN